MKTIVGTSNRILEINLSNGQVTDVHVDDDDRRQYLGGKGLGLKLLYERMERGIDPLGEKNYIAFMMGVLMGTGAPGTGRSCIGRHATRLLCACAARRDRLGQRQHTRPTVEKRRSARCQKTLHGGTDGATSANHYRAEGSRLCNRSSQWRR